MSKEILLSVEPKEIRYAFLKHNILQDLIIERQNSQPITGNIYRGTVIHVLENIQSAFIDIGEKESGFIHISDILENTQKFKDLHEMDFKAPIATTASPKSNSAISELLKEQQTVLVQVVKEPIGSKGARLTSNPSIAGRYLVLLPNSPLRGVSRKIENPTARERLKSLIRAFEMPNEMGIICRTSSVNASTEQLIAEAHELLKTWQEIVDGFHSSNKPTCLYRESDILKRTIIVGINKKCTRIMTDNYPTYQKLKAIYKKYSQEHEMKIEFYRDKMPMFERFQVDREIEKTLQRKIWLPSGGYLFFDRTEAMHTIDINSGRSKGGSGTSSKNLEESIASINMEAAEEIARQIRLRNIGGLIICDFIDMNSRKNQRRVLDRLKEALKDDPAKCIVLGVSEFGLIQMTRQRNRESLSQMINTPCPYCSGSGEIKTLESCVIELERSLRKLVLHKQEFGLQFVLHPSLDAYLQESGKAQLKKSAEKIHAEISFTVNDSLHLNEIQIFSSISGEEIAF